MYKNYIQHTKQNNTLLEIWYRIGSDAIIYFLFIVVLYCNERQGRLTNEHIQIELV